MDIFTFSVDPDISVNLDQRLKSGQKARITKLVTYSYEVDIDDYLGVLDIPDISLETLIQEELDEGSIRHSPGIMRQSDISDEYVISVEIR